jgi:hypothetical protein
MMNIQQAPYPDELADLVEHCTLDPGWTVSLVDRDRGQGSKGLTLVILVTVFDSYHPDRGRTYRVNHFFPVPPASYNRRSWQRWLFDRYLDVLIHEGAEMFKIGAEPPYAPLHGPGNDPYVIHPLGEITRTDQRTMYTGEVLP